MHLKKLTGGPLLFAAAIVLATVVIAAPGASASSSNQWKLGSYTATGGFGFTSAPLGTFAFPTLTATNPGTGVAAALLLNNTGPLTGNLTGKTITATFSISGVNTSINYGGEPDGSGAPTTVRLYFDSASITKAKNLVATNYWWSNPESVTLTGDGTGTLTFAVIPGNWSDYYGAFGNQDQSTTSAFNAVAKDVKDVGLSFGGGYFFANGVGTTDGSGTFTVNSLTVS
jgi:hypothetical protein